MDVKTLKNLHSFDCENNLESSHSISYPNISMGQHHLVAGGKRKASEGPVPSSKRQRVSCKTEVEAETATARGTKRKSSTDRESPKNKKVCSNTDTSNPPEVPVESEAKSTKREAEAEEETPTKKQRVNTDTSEPKEVLEVTKHVKEASAEKLPTAETPKTTQRESGCRLSTKPCRPSTPRQEDGSSLYTVQTSKDFEAKYSQLRKLGQGGFASVYAGVRKADNFPVAIKHIPKQNVTSRPVVFNGQTYMVPTEVLLMQKATCGPESSGKSAIVSLLDWYDAEREVLLVMERPVPSKDLFSYRFNSRGPMAENMAKSIMKQLVEAAIKLHSEGVFHRDIKIENVLVELSSDQPRVHVIDFGCGCFIRKRPYCSFTGTTAYAPPEFCMQGSYEAGPTTVWQLGTLLYELVDGYKQFRTSDFLSTTMRFFHELKLLQVSQDCKDFLRMCLAINPGQRATLEQMQLHPWLK